MKNFVLMILACMFSLSMHAQQKQPTKKVLTKEEKAAVKVSTKPETHEMKTYYMVFLKKGPKRDQDSINAGKIQAQHLAYLNKMYNEGKMDLAGPSLPDGDIRGFCVYNVESFEMAKKLAESDPAVISGRLVVEVLPWYSQKGASLR
jgi:uncharacterized protein YciI